MEGFWSEFCARGRFMKKILDPKKYGVQKYFGFKKFWDQKDFGQKNFETKKICVQKILGPKKPRS